MVRVKFTKEGAKFPDKAHKTDFAYDVYAVSEEEIAPNVWKYGLGIALQDTQGHHFSIRPRSSVWKTGMVLSNCVGTIDSGYIGEISAVFYHVMPNMPRYKVGDKIAQLYADDPSVAELTFDEVEKLEDTDRGANGYGSTDNKEVGNA